MSDKWLDYAGQSTEELIALENDYRVDSLVVAFETAVMQVEANRPLSPQERTILAVEALEREVNNGGYSQFFTNSSNEHVALIEPSLREIGCVATADVTRDAIAALRLDGTVTPERAEAAASEDNEGLSAALQACDQRYFDSGEPIADMLFAWLKRNRQHIKVT